MRKNEIMPRHFAAVYGAPMSICYQLPNARKLLYHLEVFHIREDQNFPCVECDHLIPWPTRPSDFVTYCCSQCVFTLFLVLNDVTSLTWRAGQNSHRLEQYEIKWFSQEHNSPPYQGIEPTIYRLWVQQLNY